MNVPNGYREIIAEQGGHGIGRARTEVERRRLDQLLECPDDQRIAVEGGRQRVATALMMHELFSMARAAHAIPTMRTARLSAFSSRRAVMLSRCTRMSPDLAQIGAHLSADHDEGVGSRIGGGAVAARISNEFVYAPAHLRFDMALVMTDPGDST